MKAHELKEGQTIHHEGHKATVFSRSKYVNPNTTVVIDVHYPNYSRFDTIPLDAEVEIIRT